MLRRCAGFTLLYTHRVSRAPALQSLPLPLAVAARWLSSPSFKSSSTPQHGALWRTFNAEGLALVRYYSLSSYIIKSPCLILLCISFLRPAAQFKSGKIMPALKAFQAVIEQQHGTTRTECRLNSFAYVITLYLTSLKLKRPPFCARSGHEGFPFAMSLSNIAACLRRLGRRTEAEAAYRRSIQIFRMLPQSGANSRL